MLRPEGSGVTPPLPTPAEAALGHFQQYLRQERRLSESTVINYTPVARLFLSERFPKGALHFQRITAADITAFVQRQATLVTSKRAPLVVTALRSFLRYLFLRGIVAIDLATCQMLHRQSSGRICAGFYFSDDAGRRDLRGTISSWHQHRPPAHRQTNGRDRAEGESGGACAWRNGEGERSGSFRACRRSPCAGTARDRSVAARTVSRTISRTRRDDCVREEKRDSSRGQCRATVFV